MPSLSELKRGGILSGIVHMLPAARCVKLRLRQLRLTGDLPQSMVMRNKKRWQRSPLGSPRDDVQTARRRTVTSREPDCRETLDSRCAPAIHPGRNSHLIERIASGDHIAKHSAGYRLSGWWSQNIFVAGATDYVTGGNIQGTDKDAGDARTCGGVLAASGEPGAPTPIIRPSGMLCS